MAEFTEEQIEKLKTAITQMEKAVKAVDAANVKLQDATNGLKTAAGSDLPGGGPGDWRKLLEGAKAILGGIYLKREMENKD